MTCEAGQKEKRKKSPQPPKAVKEKAADLRSRTERKEKN